jgi:hypothetical protein
MCLCLSKDDCKIELLRLDTIKYVPTRSNTKRNAKIDFLGSLIEQTRKGISFFYSIQSRFKIKHTKEKKVPLVDFQGF